MNELSKLHNLMLKAFAVAAVVAASAAAQDTAYVPFVVSVDAAVTAAQSGKSVSMTVTANVEKTLAIPLGSPISVRDAGKAQGRLNAPEIICSRGNVTLRLPPQPYQNAEVALYSVSGKRVIRGKAAAKEAATALPRQNIAAGVYIIKVSGINGGVFTSRLTHSGGKININVAFGDVFLEQRLAKAAAAGDWAITVSAAGYFDSAYTLNPVKGQNTRQNITLRATTPTPPTGSTFTDSRDSKSYKKVTIGTQTWMAENLNYNASGSVCHGNNASNCGTYGRLYDWNTALTVCPTGWHLPTDAEWTRLETAIGESSIAGKKLKSTSGWINNGNGTDIYGFSAIPGGYSSSISFRYVDTVGLWWSSTSSTTNRDVDRAWNRNIGKVTEYDDANVVYRNEAAKTLLFSVRCVQDGGTPPPTIQYTITFNANSGTVSPTSGTTGTNGRLASLPTPTRSGYTFDGWYTATTGGTAVTTSTVFSANATIYARWITGTAATYTITFNANSGTVSPTSGTTGASGTLSSLPTPTRSGYTFDGWYTATTEGTQVTQSTTFNANTTIYARWTPNIEMVSVAGGTFTMGCTSEQGSDCDSDESPSHSVTVSNFSIGKYEVTQGQWKAVMGSLPSSISSSYGMGDNYPVYYVSWNDIQTFITTLNSQTGRTYRLPTEAEWEFAARGGKNSNRYKYSGSSTIGNVAWYSSNSGNTTRVVGGKQPNELGIYDMSGNVWEWVSDWYGSRYYSSSPGSNPTGPISGSIRVFRGGSWSFDAQDCRVSGRYGDYPDFRYIILGFRLVLSS